MLGRDDGPSHGGVILHIGLDRDRVAARRANVICGMLGGVAAEIRDDDLGALPGIKLAGGEPDSAGAPGDDRNFSLQLARGSRMWRSAAIDCTDRRSTPRVVYHSSGLLATLVFGRRKRPETARACSENLTPMKIIDAQVHPPVPSQAWSPSFLPDQAAEASTESTLAAMSAVGVDAALVNSDLELCVAAVERAPDRLAGVPWLQLDVVDRATEVMEQIAAHPGLVAIRLTPGFPFDDTNVAAWRAGAFEPFLVEAARLQVPVCMFLPGHLDELHDTVRAHPHMRLIIDHLGFPPPPVVPVTEHTFDALLDLLALAEYESVAGVEVTGVPALSREPYPFTDVWPHLHRVLDAFGVEQAMSR